MKRGFPLILTAMFLIACAAFTGCADSSAPQESGGINETPSLGIPHTEALAFYSFDEFVHSIAEADAENDIYNLAGLEYYYIPSDSISNIALDAITVQERYVCIYYHLNTPNSTEASSAPEEETAGIANTVKLEWFRDAQGEELLENTIAQLSLEEISPGIYGCDISYPTQPDIVLAKSLFWVRDGYMFNLDLPLDIYEDTASGPQSAAEFTDIVKIQIGDSA